MHLRELRVRLGHALARLRRDEQGSMTVHGLFIFTTAAVVSAAGVDVTYFYGARSQLQVAADATAHAALVRRNFRTTTPAQARADAIALLEETMPPATYGEVLDTADIVFGRWDPDTLVFTPDDGSRSAVQVVTRRSEGRQNPVGSFLFRLVGVEQVSVTADAVFSTYQPACLREGFVAEGVVDIQSNNSYYKGFCVHSNAHVEANQNNFFELGSVVSMPDISDLVIPNSGFTRNEGLEDALRSSYYDLRILERVRAGADDPLQTAITTLGTPDTPTYLTSSFKLALASTTVTPASVTPGRIHTRTCTGNQTLTLTGGTYSRIVIETNCPIRISGQVVLSDAVLMTTSIDADSVKVNSGGGNGLHLGRSDACAVGGGAQIITRGGFRNSAKLNLDGGQIIALGDVAFAAQAEGHGAAIVAGGMIDGTSNMSMSSCGTGMEDNFEVPYYRLAG